jgi:hypothetical protein
VTILEPEMILKFGFTPSINMGYIPQQTTWGTTSLLKIGFLPKLAATWLPYDPADLAVKGASPVVTVSPPSSPGQGQSGTTGTLTTPNTSTPPVVSGLVRPHTPKISAPHRISPAAFAKKGVKVDLLLDQEATVTVTIVATYRSGHAAKAKTHTISDVTTRKLAAGARHLTLLESAAGKRALAALGHLRAKVEVTFTYADKTTLTLARDLEIAPAPPPKKHTTPKPKNHK